MLRREILEKIILELKKITGKNVKITRTGEIESVCPFCGGSKDNIFKRQFYINIKDKPYPFICFRCGITGILPKIINSFIPDLLCIENVNEKPEKNTDIFLYDNRDNKEYFSLVEKINNKGNLCDKCMSYLTVRLGRKNIPDFILQHTLCCKNVDNFAKNISFTGIGFFTYLRTKIIMRNLSNTGNRYITIKTYNTKIPYDFITFFPDNDNRDNIYNIFISEGVFSGLRGYQSIIEKKLIYNIKNPIIVISSGKNNYKKTFYYLNNLIPYDIIKNIFILSDNDVSLDFYESILSQLHKEFKSDIYKILNKLKVLYNNDYNDFGEYCNSIKMYNLKLRIRRNY